MQQAFLCVLRADIIRKNEKSGQKVKFQKETAYASYLPVKEQEPIANHPNMESILQASHLSSITLPIA